MSLRILALAGVVAGITFSTAVSARASTDPVIAQVRTDPGSDRNMRGVRHRIEGLIDQLQGDRHDYDGHRLKAIADLQQAREEINAALAADKRQ